ncbi:hypothetical protein L9F63_019808, partial [Diploptera punctata]
LSGNTSFCVKKHRYMREHPSRGEKSIHAIIIVEIRKLPDEMSDLEDFDHVFGIRGEEEFDRVYQRIQLEEQENPSDENNGSGFIAENSG